MKSKCKGIILFQGYLINSSLFQHLFLPLNELTCKQDFVSDTMLLICFVSITRYKKTIHLPSTIWGVYISRHITLHIASWSITPDEHTKHSLTKTTTLLSSETGYSGQFLFWHIVVFLWLDRFETDLLVNYWLWNWQSLKRLLLWVQIFLVNHHKYYVAFLFVVTNHFTSFVNVGKYFVFCL